MDSLISRELKHVLVEGQYIPRTIDSNNCLVHMVSIIVEPYVGHLWYSSGYSNPSLNSHFLENMGRMPIPQSHVCNIQTKGCRTNIVIEAEPCLTLEQYHFDSESYPADNLINMCTFHRKDQQRVVQLGTTCSIYICSMHGAWITRLLRS